jgi:hypothetical protein
MPGPHGFAVRETRARQSRARVHRIPRPTSVTIAKRPSFGLGTGFALLLFLPNQKAIKFFEDGLDRTANQCARLCKATTPTRAAPNPPRPPPPPRSEASEARSRGGTSCAQRTRCGWGDRAIASSSAKARQSVNSAISLVACAPRDDCILPRCRSDIAPTALVDQAPPVPKTARKSPPGNQECR